jgi:hypothetical protein
VAGLKNASRKFQGKINKYFSMEEISQTYGERGANER